MQWEVQGNGGLDGGAAGGGTKHRRVSKEEGFQIEGPPALRGNVTPLKHKTHSHTQTHTLRIRPQGDMPGGCGCQACDGVG